MCGHMGYGRIKNENIRGGVGVAVEDKMRENRFRWFGNVNRRPTNASVKRCDYKTETQGKRGRERPKKTWKETKKKHGVLGANGRLDTKPSIMAF